MHPDELFIGKHVRYIPRYGGPPENGRVKSFNDDVVFVVYKCEDNWDKFQSYTGVPTKLSDLKEGWV